MQRVQRVGERVGRGDERIQRMVVVVVAERGRRERVLRRVLAVRQTEAGETGKAAMTMFGIIRPWWTDIVVSRVRVIRMIRVIIRFHIIKIKIFFIINSMS